VKIIAAAMGAVAGLVVLTAVAGAGLLSMLGGASAAPSTTAQSNIPPAMLALYQAAAQTCSGLPWTVLAAIGTVESGNGTSTLPGVHSGANAAGAEGPMQFEPPTFAEYDTPVPPGGANPPSPYDATDAVFAAARLLCANGGSGGANLAGAVYSYNHSQSYVQEVLTLAQSYSAPSTPTAVSGAGVGTAAVAWALSQVGTPYVWGGESPGVGFDCSGLVQAAYLVAGLSLPRVAQAQYDAGPPVAPGTTLEPGDLVFFGGGARDVSHVGIVVAPGVMVDAPHTGADVRVEAFPPTIGAHWGSDVVVGFTRPGGGGS
jgi:cell wall-associated NlpC family hydrolase